LTPRASVEPAPGTGEIPYVNCNSFDKSAKQMRYLRAVAVAAIAAKTIMRENNTSNNGGSS